MVAVGFPQKSTFTTLRATELICPTIDSGVGALTLRRAGVTQLVCYTDRISLVRNVNLGAGIALQDASFNTILATDDLGNIDDLAPITDADGVRSDIFSSIVGSLRLQRLGTDYIQLGNNYIRIMKDPRLETDVELQDISTNPILAGDNSGNIDQLGRIDDAVKAPVGSHSILSSPAPLVPSSQSGTINEDTGYWEVSADDVLHLFLDPLLGRLGLNAEIHIDTIKVYYRTFHNDAYVDFGRVHRRSMATSGTAMIGDNSTNNGSGNTAQSNFTISVDSLMSAGYTHFMEISVEATAGDVWILGIEMNYHTV